MILDKRAKLILVAYIAIVVTISLYLQVRGWPST